MKEKCKLIYGRDLAVTLIIITLMEKSFHRYTVSHSLAILQKQNKNQCIRLHSMMALVFQLFLSNGKNCGPVSNLKHTHTNRTQKAYERLAIFWLILGEFIIKNIK